MRTLLMVRPCLDFMALTFAIFKTGAVPVLIDPGMGWPGFLRCVRQIKPEAFIGIPLAHVLRSVRRSHFQSVRIPITMGRRWFWGGWELERLPEGQGEFPLYQASDDEQAAILFTSGSTGPAKGVVYTHGIFNAQTEALRNVYHIGPDDVDLPCFPLFGLFSIALGATAVIPDMDPTKPADVNPERIIEAVEDHGVTCSFGSPALWRTVSAYMQEQGVRFSSVRQVLMAGAPVPPYLHERMLKHVLPAGAEVHTPYGATESLPVASFTGSEVLAETAARTRKGAGICVGCPLPGIMVRIIKISDEPIAEWDEALVLPQGQIGEITVKGDVVTAEYADLPEQTRLAKIHDGKAIRHRIGDLGYLDDQGRLWFCGRKNQRVMTAEGLVPTVCAEAIFNEHPRVYRSALIGLGKKRTNQVPVMVVEPEKGHFSRSKRDRQVMVQELLALAAQSDLTRGVRQVLFCRAFPVDIRHNAKINREILTAWAEKQLDG
jgi:acyl-CoA synthetase (AMP-forming)/AMP-acid ligase II